MTRHRISLEEFHRMVEAGVFPEDLRLELVEGELLEMSPIGPKHAYVVRRLTSLLAPLAQENKALLSVQNPLVVGNSELYPDLVLLPPQGDSPHRHPLGQEVLLVVEVAEASLDYDLNIKSSLYAQAGVPEVWVVDLVHRKVHVFRKPRGGRYQERHALEGGELEILGLRIPVKEVLP
ncbi:Uma2 family endonuclease [Thermus caldifontis]|uniref:Uma2 family endonuclease n=1 Tax=Thermus caldifontis TaxID=1930763 RepID=UPI000DF372CD|nr:Uma2 family endonuclease [Thermus caldifontis]